MCAKFGLNWPSGSAKENFKKFVNVFLLFRNYLILEKSIALPLKKSCIPFTQKRCVPSLVETGPVVLEKKSFKFRQCIFAISYLSPLGKRLGPSFKHT